MVCFPIEYTGTVERETEAFTELYVDCTITTKYWMYYFNKEGFAKYRKCILF